MGGKPFQPIMVQSGTAAVPAPCSMPTDAVKHILLLAWKGEPQGELCWPQQTICASFFNVSSIITLQKKKKKKTPANPLQNPRHHCALATYHKPRLQQCIQRMQPTKGTHHWLHSSQRAETHTCHPGGEKKRRTAALIIGPMKWKEGPSRSSSGAIKQTGRWAGCGGTGGGDEAGGWGCVKSAAAECWHPTNRGRVQQVPGRH